MTDKRKPTFEQALGLAKGQAAARAAARRRAATEPSLTAEQTAKWEADHKAARLRYRAARAARAAATGDGGCPDCDNLRSAGLTPTHDEFGECWA